MSKCVFPVCVHYMCVCVTPANKACCAVAALLRLTCYLSAHHTHTYAHTCMKTQKRQHTHTHICTSLPLLLSCEGSDIRLPAADAAAAAAANANAAQSLKQQWKTATNMTHTHTHTDGRTDG